MKLKNIISRHARRRTLPLLLQTRTTTSHLSLALAAVCLCTATTALAQTQNGVTGTIKDSTGAIVPNATIKIVNNATQQALTVTSSDNGSYAATGLLPGRYTITVTATGFGSTVQNDVNIEVSTQATLDIALVNGATTETVEVTSPLISLNTTAPELGTTIENDVVERLPTVISGGRGRQIDSFIFLAPGVQGSTFSHRINGGVDFQSEVVFNGVPFAQAETAGYQTLVNPPFELVNQFRVERATFSAQYGLAQGAVTYQMASGSNKIHGDIFEFNRNPVYDAVGYFNTTKPIDRENNFGGTVGGPVWIPKVYNGRDKTFFHTSIEHTKQSLSDNDLGTVPTAREKTGDFSDFVDASGKLIPIYDPQTGQPFAGNIIPQSRFSALSRSLIPSIPDPDRAGLVGNKNPTPNAIPNVNTVWGFTIDHNLTPTQSIHYTMWRNNFVNYGFDNAPIVPTSNILQSQRYYPNKGSVYLLNYVNAVTPHLVMTAGVDWVGELNNQFNQKTGVSFGGVVASPIATTFPNIVFDGTNAGTSFGTSGGNSSSVNRKLGVAVVNNWLWTHGIHTLNIGGELRRVYQDDNECQFCAGQFNFSRLTTANPASLSSTTGSSFASFLLGQVDSAQRIFANELRLRNLSVSPYIQDDIKFTPKLTVNAGLRWDILLPFKENNNQIVYLDPTRANSAAGGLPGAATKFGFCATCSGRDRADIYAFHISPRFGISYQFNEKTVLQTGYSLAFLDGGSYEYGTSKVAVSYGNLLQGSFTRNSNNTTVPGYGAWDGNPLPAPAVGAFSPTIGNGTTIRAFDPVASGHAPYIQQYNLNLQRQLPWNTFVQAAYVGNHIVHLPGQLNTVNQPNPSILKYGPLLKYSFSDPVQAAALRAAGFTTPYAGFVNDFGSNATLAQSLSPYPQYSDVYNNFDLSGAANYQAFQLSVEKRFSNGLSFLTSYTLSKTLSNVDSGFSTFAARSENKYNQYPEYTVASNDVRHNTKVSGTYDLPLGPGKALLNSKGIVGQVLGGFQVGAILTYYSGTPFGIEVSNSNPLGFAGGFNRPNIVPGAKIGTIGYNKNTAIVGRSGARPVFTTAAFAQPGTYELGNAERNYNDLRNPASYNENLNVRKAFTFTESIRFILQADFFNALNRTILGNPNTNLGDGNFGLVSSGSLNNTERRGQVSGKLTF